MGKPGYKAEISVGASPTVLGKGKNAELNSSAGVIDITTRDSAGWKKFLQGLKEWDVSVDCLWVQDDAGYELLQTAFANGTEIAVKLLDEAGATGHGFSGNAIVTGIKRAEALEDALMVSVTLKGTGALTFVDPA